MAQGTRCPLHEAVPSKRPEQGSGAHLEWPQSPSIWSVPILSPLIHKTHKRCLGMAGNPSLDGGHSSLAIPSMRLGLPHVTQRAPVAPSTGKLGVCNVSHSHLSTRPEGRPDHSAHSTGICLPCWRLRQP